MIGLLLFLAALSPHPQSLSSSRVEVEGAEAHVTLRCQALSFAEVLPRLDLDGDGSLDAAEVEGGTAELFDYVARRYVLSVGTDFEGGGGTPLEPRFEAVTFEAQSDGHELLRFGGAVAIRFSCTAPDSIEDLGIEMRLFREAGSEHVDLATLVWPDGTARSFALDARTPRVRAAHGGGGTFLAFARLGLEHILAGWDHLAFLLALLLSSRSLRSVLGWATAFTAAHSVTLALATLGAVRTEGWEPLIESAIALSIAYVAADNLWRPELPRARWVEAFLFGLLHGLGFAGFLEGALVLEEAKLTALLGFNLGVEVGQLAVVAVLAAPFVVRARRRAEAPEFLLPRALRVGGSILVCGLGLWWFFERL